MIQGLVKDFNPINFDGVFGWLVGPMYLRAWARSVAHRSVVSLSGALQFLCSLARFWCSLTRFWCSLTRFWCSLTRFWCSLTRFWCSLSQLRHFLSAQIIAYKPLSYVQAKTQLNLVHAQFLYLKLVSSVSDLVDHCLKSVFSVQFHSQHC